LSRKSARPSFADVSESRRRNMAAISGKNTKPELLVRRMLHRSGYRFRIHVRGLPGQPDIVFPRRRKIIEVRGCYWHRHPGCPQASTPQTRAEFWHSKFEATVERDARNLAALEGSGWSVLVLWECEINDEHLMDRIRQFLGPSVRE
jgi:DNA mismatch endonuclease Vsr